MTMNWSQQIHLLVAAVVVGVFAMLVAFVGAPLVATIFWPSPDVSNDVGGFVESMSAAQRIANASDLVSLGSLVVAAICFVYVLVVLNWNLAVWFFGPKRNSSDDAA
jgi:hypothetical protein